MTFVNLTSVLHRYFLLSFNILEYCLINILIQDSITKTFNNKIVSKNTSY